MSNQVRILGIAGSLRRQSFNRPALRAATDLVPEGATLESFALDAIPAFNQEEAQKPPAKVTELKNKIRAAVLIYRRVHAGQRVETAWKGEFIEPLRTFYTVEKGFNFKQPRCAENEYWNTCWPTRALSGLTVYESAGIPGWSRSLLAPSLKTGAVYRVLLSADGTAAPEPTYQYFKTINRYRDVLVSADGRTIYVAIDSGGPTHGRRWRHDQRLGESAPSWLSPTNDKSIGPARSTNG